MLSWERGGSAMEKSREYHGNIIHIDILSSIYKYIYIYAYTCNSIHEIHIHIMNVCIYNHPEVAETMGLAEN